MSYGLIDGLSIRKVPVEPELLILDQRGHLAKTWNDLSLPLLFDTYAAEHVWNGGTRG